MKKLKKGEKGLTLVELLIVIAITGVITAAITTTIIQVFNMNTHTTNRMTAVRQVQQAGFWVSPDVQMAQSVNASGSSGFPLILTWTDEWASNDTHTVNYTLEGGELWRSHSVNGGNSTVTLVAEYIDSGQTNCSPLGVLPSGYALNFTVTATVGEESETRVYEVKPRPGS